MLDAAGDAVCTKAQQSSPALKPVRSSSSAASAASAAAAAAAAAATAFDTEVLFEERRSTNECIGLLHM
jgi:hypothetical protein